MTESHRLYVNRNRRERWQYAAVFEMLNVLTANGLTGTTGSLHCKLVWGGLAIEWGDGARVIINTTRRDRMDTTVSFNSSAHNDIDTFVDELKALAPDAHRRGWAGFGPAPELL